MSLQSYEQDIKDLQNDLLTIADTIQGRRLLKRILVISRESSYVAGDAMATAFREGRRAISLTFENLILNADKSRDLLHKIMITEIENDRKPDPDTDSPYRD